jgi:hypothetical protein
MLRAVIALLASAFLVTACSGSTPSGDDEGGLDAAEHEGAGEEPSPEEAALQAYDGLWDALVEGSHQGATDHPYFERFAKDQALELVQDLLTGAEAVGEPVRAPEVVDADPDGDPPTVWLEDCVEVSPWRFADDPADDDTEPSFRLVESTVTLENSAWKVERFWWEDYGSCEQ